jgi:hypothetical protein
MPRHLTSMPGHRTPDWRPAAFIPARPSAFPARPTASSILAQGKAALAAAALGCGRKSTRRLKACPIIPPTDASPVMKQAFSLPSPQGAALG